MADVPPAPNLAPQSDRSSDQSFGPATAATTAATAPLTRVGGGAGVLVLASGSPRRRDLLRRLGLEPEVVPADVDETPGRDEPPAVLVRRLATAKVLAVAATRSPDDVVVGGDTVVTQDGRVLGKPADRDEAVVMLRSLSGRGHQAVSGVAVARGGTRDAGAVRVDVATTVVGFRELNQRDLDWYLRTGQWEGKAGAYGLQGPAGAFVSNLQGLDTTVIGLPLGPTVILLRAVGLDVLDA